jgi:phenylpyruvate tautomerase
MPLLKITTNQEIPAEQQTVLLKTASENIANMLGKPERYVMVVVETNPAMCFAGETTPLAYLELKSIGLPADRTSEFSNFLCELMAAQLQIPADRIYIEFSDAERHLWGWNAATF